MTTNNLPHAAVQDSKTKTIENLKNGVPPELMVRDQWVLYRMEPGSNGKPTKVPYSVTGYKASNTDSSTWTGFYKCVDAFEAGGYDGLGYVFSKDDPYTGVDLDHHVTDDAPGAQARDWLQELDSYSEYSQSGTGIHIIVRASKPGDKCKNAALGVEIYDHDRFFVMTGNRVAKTPKQIYSRQAELDTFYAEVFADKLKPKAATNGTSHQSSASTLNDIDDQWLIDKLLNHPTKGQRASKLWAGDASDYLNADGSIDESGADQALANELAWLTGNDAARMDRLFRHSGLMRDKWNRDDYREMTIDEAISVTVGAYDPLIDEAIEAAQLFAEEQMAARAKAASASTPSNGTQTGQTSNGNGASAQQQNGGTPPPQPPKSPFLSFDELMSLPPKQWLVDGVFGERDIVMVYGEPGSGKTFVLMDMIFAACQGEQWAGKFDVTRPLTVAYCAGEGVSGLKDRFAAAKDAWGISTLPNFYFLPFAPQLFAGNRADAIKAQVTLFKTHHGDTLDVLIIDTLHAATAGADENSAKDMGLVLTAVRDAMRELGCTVILCHHTGKDGERERGSSALHGAMDTMIKVKKNGEHSIECFKLKDGEPWKPQQFTLISKGPSVYVFWDGQVATGGDARHSGVRQEIIDLLLTGRGKSYTVKEIVEGIGGAQTPQNVREIAKNLVKDKIAKAIDYGEGKRTRWGYQIEDAWAAVQSVVENHS